MKLPKLVNDLKDRGYSIISEKDSIGVRYDLYDREHMPAEANSPFYASIYLTNGNKKYMHNGITYTDINSLLAGIDWYNAHTEYPYWLYSPGLRPGVFEEGCIIHHLRKLGFEYTEVHNRFVFYDDSTDVALYTILVLPNYFEYPGCTNETAKGGTIKFIVHNGLGESSAKYTDLDGAISIISAILLPYVYMFETKILNLLYNIKGFDISKFDDIAYTKLDLADLRVRVSSMTFKEYIKAQLQNLLNQLD